MGKKHIISTPIEHKAILEPLAYLKKQGFEITFAKVDSRGWVEPDEIEKLLRNDTLAISVMQVNNETGVLQPISDICKVLENHDAIFHVDAAQGFGKELSSLNNKRIDLISISGHKIFASKGVGALIVRKRGYRRIALAPLMFGGGQERGLRPGTVPVPLVAGLGLASELAVKNLSAREEIIRRIRKGALDALLAIGGVINGDGEKVMPHILNISFPGIDSEAAIIALKDLVAISNGSACTSQSYSPSHVLTAMGLDEDRLNSALRFSWCHLTPQVDWNEIAKRIKTLY
jgi:cysteine desulfurase